MTIIGSKGMKGHLAGLAAALLALTLSTSAFGQGLVPDDFFNAPVDQSAPTGVEADTLTFDSRANTITASGNVILKQGGYTLSGQNLVYERNSGKLQFVGDVSVRDPSGNIARMANLEVREGMKQAFMTSLTITAYDGSLITADSVDYDTQLQSIMNQATYAPCGECIDTRGQRIGWSIKASRIVKDEVGGSITLEQPTLELLGVPVAWLPMLWLPDAGSAFRNFRMPNYSYGEKTGHTLEIPYYVYSTKDTDLILTPTLMSRQYFLLGAEWIQRFDNGSFQIKASGLRQPDPDAFTFAEAKRDWRGAIQTSGQFTPLENWTAGWSYSAFTDAAYLEDYRLTNADSATNEVYATYLTDDSYFDARVQQFNRIGDYTEASQGQQAQTLPNVTVEHVEDLPPGMGRIEISGKLLGTRRTFDSAETHNGVPYLFGYEGLKQHATLQAGWQTQWVGAGGIVATPYLGGRLDYAYYDGASALSSGAQTLWSATPIAAIDVRYPLVAQAGSTSHIIEPIAQVVYRGSNTTAVGITNDNAQSFVFDDTNLFSYNRFTGSDRQETGLRANLGVRYQASFSDSGYLEVIAGQSFQIAEANAFASADHVQTGVGAGLDAAASYAVLGAYAGLESGLKAGGKLLYDTQDSRVARASLGGTYSQGGWAAEAVYNYIAANPEAGTINDQHEIGGEVTVPVSEYWSVKASSYWDLAANSWLQVGGGLVYDDGYLEVRTGVTRNGPTHTDPNETRITAGFALKTPAGFNLGQSGGTTLSD